VVKGGKVKKILRPVSGGGREGGVAAEKGIKSSVKAKVKRKMTSVQQKGKVITKAVKLIVSVND